MTRVVSVDLGIRSYPIFIGPDLIDRLGTLTAERLVPGGLLVVTDEIVGAIYLERALKSLGEAGFRPTAVVIPSGESSKDLSQAQRLYDAALDAGLDRRGAIVALGGGVVGDLAGFMAATYLRGVPFVQVPTTLLAQVDSSVGGKVGINLPRGKNLVGAFHQPTLVVADVASLRTLAPREVSAGLAEVVKHGVIADPGLLDRLEAEVQAIRAMILPVMAEVVERNCRIKASVVREDEREEGRRAILNFGHTLGHAIEKVAGYGRFLHGEAVAVGMPAAARVASALGILKDPALVNRLEALLQAFDLPIRAAGLDPIQVLQAMEFDKKGRLRWILPVAAGEVIIREVPPEIVLEAVDLVTRS